MTAKVQYPDVPRDSETTVQRVHNRQTIDGQTDMHTVNKWTQRNTLNTEITKRKTQTMP